MILPISPKTPRPAKLEKPNSKTTPRFEDSKRRIATTDFRQLFVGRKSRTMSTLSLLASLGIGWRRNWKPSFMCLRSRVLYTVLSHSSWIYVVEPFLRRWQTRIWKRREDVPKSASSHACVQRWFNTVMSVFPKDFSWDEIVLLIKLKPTTDRLKP